MLHQFVAQALGDSYIHLDAQEIPLDDVSHPGRHIVVRLVAHRGIGQARITGLAGVPLGAVVDVQIAGRIDRRRRQTTALRCLEWGAERWPIRAFFDAGSVSRRTRLG